MSTTLRWLAVPLLLVATTAVAPAADVRDDAGLFSPEAVREAETALKQGERGHRVPVVIETVRSLGGEPIADASLRRAKASGKRGLHVLISKDDHKLYVRDAAPELGPQRREAIIAAFTRHFGKNDYDAGLKDGVRTLNTVVAEVGGMPRATPTQRPRVAAQPAPAPRPRSSGMGTLLTIGLIVLAVLIGVRVLGSLFSGGRSGSGGPARMGGPGYGGGGGGGGFMSGLFGGLGGALAGNWLYDQMSGRHHGTSYGDAGAPIDPGPPADTGGDWGTGSEGSWGDAGGGGGDWGGGGGGDWGGGGGDGGGDGGSW